MSRIFEAIKQLEQERAAALERGSAGEAGFGEAERTRLNSELEAARERAASAEAREQGLLTAISQLGDRLRDSESSAAALREDARAERERLEAELAGVRQEAERLRQQLEHTEADLKRVRVELNAMRPGGAMQEKLRDAERRQAIEIQKNVERLQVQLEQVQGEVKARQQYITTLEHSVRTAERKVSEQRSTHERELEAIRRDTSEALHRVTAEQRQMAAQLDGLRKQEGALRTTHQTALAERDRLAAELAAERHSKAELSDRLEALEPRLLRAEAEANELRGSVAALRDESTRLRRECESAAAARDAAEEALRRSRARTAVLESEIQSADAARGELERAAREVQLQLAEVREQVAASEGALHEANERRHQLTNLSRDLDGQLGAAREEITRLLSLEHQLQARLLEESQSRSEAEERHRATTRRLQETISALEGRCGELAAQCDSMQAASEAATQLLSAERESAQALRVQLEADLRAARQLAADEAARFTHELLALQIRCKELEEQADRQRRAASAESKRAAAVRDQLRLALAQRDSELAAAREEAGAEMHRLRTELDDLEARLQRQHERNEAAECAARQSAAQRGQLEAAITERANQIIALQERIEAERARAEARVSELRARCGSMESERDAARREAQAALGEAAERREALESELARRASALTVQARAEHEGKLRELEHERKRENEQVTSRIRDLDEHCRSLEHQLAAAQELAHSAATRADGQRMQLEERLSAREHELNAARLETVQAGQRVAELTAQCRTLETQYQALEEDRRAEREHLLNVIAQREAEFASTAERVGGESAHAEAVADRMRELESRLAERSARCQQLEAQLTAAARILDRLRAQREELVARLSGPSRASSSSAG